MQLKNFYRKLESLTKKNNLEWRMSRDGKIRCTLNSRCHCPVTAVINMELGRRVNVRDVEDFSDKIGLDIEQTAMLAKSADFPSKDLSGHGKLCRAALLRATGLV